MASDAESRLIANLFEEREYNSLIRPVKTRSETIDVSFEMALIQIITLDEKKQFMKTNIWLRLGWSDYKLTWDPSQYDGLNLSLRIDSDRVWKPDIVLLNNADGRFEVSFKSNVLIDHNGGVMWVPCSIYKSSCRIDVNYFPFDEQRCNMSYGSWTYNADEVRLNPYTLNFSKVDLTDYEKSGTWDVVDVPAEFLTYEKEGQNISRAEYIIVLRRKTLFYAVNLILPCVLISMLTMVVFYLPTTAGEKITMSVSIFLALIVFLQVLVTNLLPPSSLSLPLFAKYLIFTVILDVCCIINTIISINWSWRTPRTHLLSPAMRTFFFDYVAWFLMMRRPVDAPQAEPPVVVPTSSTSRDELDLSQLHHMDCRYARMSTRQRRRVLEAGSSHDELPREHIKAVEAVRFAAAHLKNENDFSEVIDDWKYLSLIFDRFLLYVYAIVTLVGTLSILMYAPHIFTDFDQQGFRRELTIERCCKEVGGDNPTKLRKCYESPYDYNCKRV